MSVMTIPEAWYAQDRTLTVEDMENMPDDEFRYELDDGVLIVSPAPTNRHQLAVTRLAVILTAACPAGARGARGRRRQHQQVPAPGTPTWPWCALAPLKILLPGDSARAGGRGSACSGRGSMTGTGRRPSTRASASPRTGSSSRTLITLR